MKGVSKCEMEILASGARVRTETKYTLAREANGF
jgi:hypothetical protein